MVLKRKDDESTVVVDKKEIKKLTKMAKSWEFTCSFCFKKFPSAQAMGGHLNAHRNERLEEKRQLVRDPISHRRRAYLRSMKTSKTESSGTSNPTLNMHATSQMTKHELANINAAPKALKINDLGEFNAENTLTSLDQQSSCSNDENVSVVVMNFFPPKELSLLENVGVVHAEDAKGKACVESDAGYGVNLEKLDLTLQL